MGKKSDYHIINIPKGKYGESSKIKEEILEFIDAEKQGDLILQICKLSDIYGAFEGYVEKHFNDLDMFNDIINHQMRPQYCESGNDLLNAFNKCFCDNEPNIFWLRSFSAAMDYLLDLPIYLNFEFEDLKKYSDKTKAAKFNICI